MADATKRFAAASAAGEGSITVGLAALEPGDDVDALVSRADAAMYRRRQA